MASDGFMHSLGPVTGSFSIQSLCWPRPPYLLMRVFQYVRIRTYSLGSRTHTVSLLIHSFGLNTSQGQPDSIHFWIEGVLLWFTIRHIYLIDQAHSREFSRALRDPSMHSLLLNKEKKEKKICFHLAVEKEISEESFSFQEDWGL